MNNELYEVRVRKFKNTDKFRQAAIHFNNYGYYTAAPPGTTEYKKYWDEEMKRCKYGFTAEDGDTITGYHYFYLNYCPIMKVVKKEVPDKKGGTRTVYSKEQSLPDFWDYDKEFFDAIDEAEYVGSHAAVIKKRRSGYSFKVASMLNRNFFLIPGSVSYAIASEAEFLTKDGVLSKAWQMMSFIDDHTAWTKKRQVHDTKMHKRASFITTKDGTQVEKGYKSEIIGITLKNDPQKARGKSGKLIVWEEAGKFPGLLDAWQIARPSVEQDGHAYGTMIAFGTGGTTEGDYSSLKELFYHPAGYNILPVNNVWDEGAEGTPCGFFVPNYMNMQDLMDEDGNSMIKEAIEKTNKERRKVEQNSGDKNAIDRHIAEHPNCLHGSTWVSNEGIQKNVYNERIKNIDNKFENGFQDLYKLTTENNRELICTETHHIYDGTNYRPLSDYEEGDKIELLPTKFSHSYQYVNINYGIGNINFDLKIDEDWAKFIGLFMGDGSFYSRRYANDLEFSLDKKDLNTLNWLESFIYEKDFGACNIEEIGGMVRLRVSNRKLLDLFIHLGLIQRATEKSSWKRKVHVPEYIMKSPERVVASFLSGLYDSDGSISKDQGSISFYTKYEQFAKDIMLLLSGFDIYPKYKKSEYINSNGRKYIGRRLTIRKSNNSSFYRNIGFISKRKQDILSDNKSSKYKQWNFDYIKSIEYWGKDEVYNLETETKYYSANGIHTHNSPMEATLQLAGNIFPKKELQDQLAKIQTDKKLYNYKQVGDLKFGPDGRLKWVQTTDSKDITKFPLDKNDDKHGAVVIWEHPVEDPPYGLYIAGCLTPGEKVKTDKGLKNVEDVTLDDKLINKEGELVDINTLLRYEKEDEPIYKIKVSNIYRTTTLTQEHPLYVSDSYYNSNNTINSSNFNFDFVRVRNVKEGQWIKYPNVYKKNKPYNLPFNIEDEDYFWWFVGLWLGDGWADKNKIYVSFNKDEYLYIDKFINIANNIFDRKVYSRLRGNCIELSFGHQELSLFLNETFGLGASSKNIPEWVKYIPWEYKVDLLQGYLDSDGSILRNKKYYSTEFVSVSQELLEDIQDILFSIGIISNMNKLRNSKQGIILGRDVEQLDTYHLRLSHHSTLQFVNEVHDKIDHKINKVDIGNLPDVRQRPKDGCFFSNDLDYIYLQIKDIKESTYTGTVYNFDCETHSFISPYCTGHNCDPYDHDESTTSSLGSTFIYKRFQSFEEYYDIIVAEYTGRPDSAEEYYENVLKLLKYYNARLLYENERKGLYAHFAIKGYDYMLANQPDIISDIISTTKVQRKKGIHMTKAIKDWGEREIRDWLNEEYAPGHKNLEKIMSIPLLQELIAYNDKGNFDRVIALMMVMLYKKELHNVHVKEKKKTTKVDNFFKKRFFTDDRKFNFNRLR